MERAKLMTAFPSLIFPVSEQRAPISSLACQGVGNVALIKWNLQTTRKNENK